MNYLNIKIEKIHTRTLALIMKIARLIPKFSLFEYQIYRNIETQISKTNIHPIKNTLPAILLHKICIRESISNNSNYHIIDINNISDQDISYIKKQGFSIEHITANIISEHDRTFQLKAIKNSHISAVCPNTGQILHSTRSILTDSAATIFYRFVGLNQIFYLAVGREGQGFVKLYIYIPIQEIVILLGNIDWAWLGRWELDKLRAHIIFNHKYIYEYLNNKSIPSTCILVDHPHFAHHIWNTLTGLNKIISNQYLEHIDKIIVTQEPIGPIEQLFPEFKNKNIERLSNQELLAEILARNIFLIRPGGAVVSKNLVTRIHHVALLNSQADFIKEAQNFRMKHWPILWATIRTGNRTWVSQAEGIARIANMFKSIYPDFALIVDGYAIPYGKHINNKHLETILTEEEKVVQHIIDLLDPSIEARYFVGKHIFESIVYSKHIDFYLAHHGSLQHKICWLSNTPGVVHVNREVLLRVYGPNPEIHAAFKAIKTKTSPIYLDIKKVSDIQTHHSSQTSRWESALKNYDFDYQHAFDKLHEVVLNLKKETK